MIILLIATIKAADLRETCLKYQNISMGSERYEYSSPKIQTPLKLSPHRADDTKPIELIELKRSPLKP
jgi:hypothetical protein